ncbi:MAG: selenium cofactor biosynthesis protein YqeC [Desulfomonilaceae bacterium]
MITFVGAGGKTSLMFNLANEIVSRDLKVVTTTTTKIFVPSTNQAAIVHLANQENWDKDITKKLETFDHVCFGKEIDSNTKKLLGINPADVSFLTKFADFIVVEADGALGRPVKCPESWEPAIPQRSNIVIFVVGMDCLGQPANSQTVHRIDKFLNLSGLEKEQPIDCDTLVELVTHAQGAYQNVPKESLLYVAFNKTDLFANLTVPLELAEKIISVIPRKINGVILTGDYEGKRKNVKVS